jgi:hypothetical protein
MISKLFTQNPTLTQNFGTFSGQNTSNHLKTNLTETGPQIKRDLIFKNMKKQRFNTTDDSEKTKNDLAIVSHVEDWMSSKLPHHPTSKAPHPPFKSPPPPPPPYSPHLIPQPFSFPPSPSLTLSKTLYTRAPTINTSMLNTITQPSPLTLTLTPATPNPKTLTPFTKKGVMSNLETLNGKFNQEILEGLIKRRMFKTANNGFGVQNCDISTVKMVGTEFTENFKILKGNMNVNVGGLYRKVESD